MTTLSDFSPDVQAAARQAVPHWAFEDNRVAAIELVVASAIMADRQQRVDTSYLTKRQAECLRFIARYQGENDGVTPSYDQIRAALGLASKSGVTRLVQSLEERGRIKRMPGLARALTIIATPAGA